MLEETKKLRLFKAELLDYDSLLHAIHGFAGVFHLASPVYPPNVVDPEVDVIELAVKGTVNELNACVEAKVKPSGAAVTTNPICPKDHVMDETCWSDKDFQRQNKDLILEQGSKIRQTRSPRCVDCLSYSLFGSNVAIHHQQKRHSPHQSSKRKIHTAHMMTTWDLVEKLKSMYPGYNYPKRFATAEEEQKMNSEKLQKLGWKDKPSEETLMDSVRAAWSPMKGEGQPRFVSRMKKERRMEEGRICVTGAGGFIASWVVKLLLSRGYKVHGTVRDPSDPKNAHLKSLENAHENLWLFKAELLNYESIRTAVSGCAGVLHVASPVPAGKVDLYEPALAGTKNVLNACLKEKVNKVIVVSSIAAVVANQSWPKDQAMDETCWSDLDYCRSRDQWYSVAKTMAETEAWEVARRTGLNVVTICPSLVFGPMLQPTLNSSSLYLLTLMKGRDPAEHSGIAFVDVRDTAEAILLVYESPDAEGRYICSSYELRNQAIVEILKKRYPEYDYPKSFKEVLADLRLSSLKLQNLGWKYRPLEEALVDVMENYKQIGALDRSTNGDDSS
ncbi:hypothetical protein MLD38_012804 [Melastoma candidum]|uniref:Uncharacterized protein n=1 Tax=Melastoma candidum TaxID=119954 RepID=A0ACB9R7H5_9MYRT|nr:hypothetical protein MLD38_012804 [Melastoma candidum]